MKRIEFKPPPALSIPEGMGSGDTFERISTYRVKPNGDLCLVAIGEVQMPGYSDKKGSYDDGMRQMGEHAAGRYREKMSGGPPLNDSESMGAVGGGY